MKDSPLEMIAHQYDNVVQYDANGNPSIFVKFPKMKSSELDASLPSRVHPAFTIGGEEQDYILLGKFKSAELREDGTLYSLANLPPKVNLNYDEHLARMRAFGNGASGMTIADHGLLVLLSHKKNREPRGNNNYGSYGGLAQISEWAAEYPSYKSGDVVSFRGWSFRCILAHKPSNELHPFNSPLHWYRLKHIGGVTCNHYTGVDYSPHEVLTLNGSGPMTWYWGGDPASLCDIVGNCREAVYGIRLVNCEIQILGADNQAARDNTDCSSGGKWKAIKPGSSSTGYSLVEPGSGGTLHFVKDSNGNAMIDNAEPEFNNNSVYSDFRNTHVNTDHIAYIPSILYELGLVPISSSTHVMGKVEFRLTQNEQIAYRAGCSPFTDSTGMGSLYFTSRTRATYNEGSRARSMPSP